MGSQDGEEFRMKPQMNRQKKKSPNSGTSNSDAEKSYKVMDAEESIVKISIPISKTAQPPSREIQHKFPEARTGNPIKQKDNVNMSSKLKVRDKQPIQRMPTHKKPTSNAPRSQNNVDKIDRSSKLKSQETESIRKMPSQKKPTSNAQRSKSNVNKINKK